MKVYRFVNVFWMEYYLASRIICGFIHEIISQFSPGERECETRRHPVTKESKKKKITLQGLSRNGALGIISKQSRHCGIELSLIYFSLSITVLGYFFLLWTLISCLGYFPPFLLHFSSGEKLLIQRIN